MSAALDGAKPRLLIGCYFPRSVALEGIGNFVRGIAIQMARMGCHVKLLWPEGDPIQGTNVEVLPYGTGPTGLWRYLSALRSASRTVDAVLLVENNPNMGFAASFSAIPNRTYSYFCTPLQYPRDWRAVGSTLQSWTHGVAKHPLWGKLQNWSDRRCIVASQYQAKQLLALGVSQVLVMPASGVSSACSVPDRQQARRQLGWDRRPVVGYLGHFSPAKGVDVLVDAFSAHYDGPAVLALAHSGKGRLPAKHTRRMMALSTAGRARLSGVVDPLVFLAGCDIVALPYITSSIYHPPQVMLESFAASTMVISASVGGIDEFVSPGESGVLTRPGNPESLAVAISRCLGDLEACHETGRRARSIFRRTLSAEVFCSGICELIRRSEETRVKCG